MPRPALPTSLVFRRSAALLLCAAGLTLTACNQRTTNQDERELRQQSADATRQVQKGAKELAAGTKTAAANAVDGVNAVAQGVKDGVNGGDAAADRVDINSASTARLALLPGIGLSKAHDIVEGRPYRGPHALVARGLLTEEQYSRIAGRIAALPPR